jgi:hypothetical protein
MRKLTLVSVAAIALVAGASVTMFLPSRDAAAQAGGVYINAVDLVVIPSEMPKFLEADPPRKRGYPPRVGKVGLGDMLALQAGWTKHFGDWQKFRMAQETRALLQDAGKAWAQLLRDLEPNTAAPAKPVMPAAPPAAIA